ncbi:hypothetical protein [Neorhodopirellula pilleata]|uniref:Uncharacterized protein n=1 Tax=Neorhodopirellula pilleata TaxID=2714738 RepID=A0A5C6AWK6_9BACT|nr:hypothetical protein [Neorhodopirellula pilleata]TWU03529.1 hypothetical protein Pla100_04560 [Neorhodopirellula pilleata]
MSRFLHFARLLPAFSLGMSLILVVPAPAAEVSFRPEPGKFPPLEKAHSYRGELVFVDHANRRGSIRVQGDGKFYRNDPHPFAMLPYGIVRYHGAPADLRDVPLGTVLHVRAFLPPDPKQSAVPVLPVDNKEKDAGHYRGTGVFPAENHVLLLEDEPSHCLREGLAWKLIEVELKDDAGKMIASREPKAGGDGNAAKESLTFDAATRIWRGRERIRVADLVAEEAWPASGKKQLDGQAVLLGITWKPAPGDGLSGAFTQFHISDIWLDDDAIENAAHFQTETHKTFIRSRWMPAWIDAVEYGKFGRANVTATLFGGMDDTLYQDFTKGIEAQINGAENTLKHAAGHYGPSHVASSGKILDVTAATGEVPLGSSGIQIHIETDLIIEGIRPGRVVRIRPESWPKTQIPREEYLLENNPEDRFPSPDIFPKY